MEDSNPTMTLPSELSSKAFPTSGEQEIQPEASQSARPSEPSGTEAEETASEDTVENPESDGSYRQSPEMSDEDEHPKKALRSTKTRNPGPDAIPTQLNHNQGLTSSTQQVDAHDPGEGQKHLSVGENQKGKKSRQRKSAQKGDDVPSAQDPNEVSKGARRLEDKIARLTKANQHLKAKISEMAKEKVESKKECNKLRNSALEKPRAKDPNFMLNDDIQSKFKDIGDSLDGWVEDYALESVPDQPWLKKMFTDLLQRVEPDFCIFNRVVTVAAIKEERLKPRKMLSAAVAVLGICKIFKNGFTWVNGADPDSQASDKLWRIFRQVKDNAFKSTFSPRKYFGFHVNFVVKPPQDIHWRRSTLNIMENWRREEKGPDRPPFFNPEKEKIAYAGYLSSQIISLCHGFLKDLNEEDIKERQERLESICGALINHSTSCYLQDVRIHLVFSKTEMTRRKQLPFPASSDLFDSRTSEGTCDSDNPRKETHKVGLVTRPAIIAWNKDRHNKENPYTVWMKGEVWLGEVSEKDAEPAGTVSGAVGRPKRKRGDVAQPNAQELPNQAATLSSYTSHQHHLAQTAVNNSSWGSSNSSGPTQTNDGSHSLPKKKRPCLLPPGENAPPRAQVEGTFGKTRSNQDKLDSLVGKNGTSALDNEAQPSNDSVKVEIRL